MASNNPFTTDLKARYLRNAANEARLAHPGKTPASLICPISRGLMQVPMITPEGFVYDKEWIVNSVAQIF